MSVSVSVPVSVSWVHPETKKHRKRMSQCIIANSNTGDTNILVLRGLDSLWILV